MRSCASNRRGSALLIVLGMLSFMVISAVAFSALMRTSRLPSSYLRRTVASRMLVKAALARAIDEIDAAVGNNPHPNIGQSKCRRLDEDAAYPSSSQERNTWLGRVWIGTNDTATIEADETVPTLTLEALAYLPPSLINEARYYSRHATSAKWHPLDYDAGRYAFTAIDVSDFFDINCVKANEPRSSDPGSRITLGHLFDNTIVQEPLEGTDQEWDNFMKPFQQKGVLPLVSLADWNLAVYNKLTKHSPFCAYVNGATTYYNGNARYANMTFVTDSWMPATLQKLETGSDNLIRYGNMSGVANQDILDLVDLQPFDDVDMNWEKGSASGCFAEKLVLKSRKSNNVFNRLYDGIPLAGLAALVDYLDYDNVPISLAMPTMEQVPMVCGLTPRVEGAVHLTVTKNPDSNGEDTYLNQNEAGTERTAVRVQLYKMDDDALHASAQTGVDALMVYPFRNWTKRSENYTVEGKLSLFFAYDDAPVTLRAGALSSDHAYPTAGSVSAGFVKGVVTRPLAGTGFPVGNIKPSSGLDEHIHTVQLKVSGSRPTAGFGDTYLLKATHTWTQTRTKDALGNLGPWTPEDPPKSVNPTLESQFQVMESNGHVTTLPASAFNGGKTLVLNAAYWVVVKDNAQNVVDMVPACGEDDVLNFGNHDRELVNRNFSPSYPLMRFVTPISIKLTLDDIEKAASTGASLESKLNDMENRSVMIADPRYNYAPEAWFKNGSAVSISSWTTKNLANGRDGDIFQIVSNQGELQSVYELANLPRLTKANGFGNYGNATYGALVPPAGCVDFHEQEEAYFAKDFMWKTYDPFGEYTSYGDGFENFGIVNDGGGFKVNPYTDSTNVMMAVFANTPRDWSLTSLNDTGVRTTFSDFNRDCTWNDVSPAKINVEDLEDLAGAFMEDMRSRNPEHQKTNEREIWEPIWRELEWSRSSKSILDSLSIGGELYNAEKKFLYGFWHDCFAVRQQLFLVIVRAEPSMMGGGAPHQTPPQLGARALALVWRDPTETKDNTPHRTRVLFYRQLD